MGEPSYSDQFLARALHHFVAMAFLTKLPSGQVRPEMRSCFIAQVESEWLLITAGHVIETLRGYRAQGMTLSNFELHDRWAGHQFARDGVPFHFDPEGCLYFHEIDADYAAWVLDGVTIRALQAGGVRPIEEVAWKAPPPSHHDVLILIGLPTETLFQHGTKMHAAPTLIPLELTEAPSTSLEPLHQDVHVARLVQADPPLVSDVDGMSGSPIFGLKRDEDGTVRYHVVGVQSGWLRSSRQVTFFAALPFFDAVANAIRRINGT